MGHHAKSCAWNFIHCGHHRRGERPFAPTEHHPGPQPKSIGALVAGFKSAVTKRINALRDLPGIPVWQRNYYEHIIRDETELSEMRAYIINNPINWQNDKNYIDEIKGR